MHTPTLLSLKRHYVRSLLQINAGRDGLKEMSIGLVAIFDGVCILFRINVTYMAVFNLSKAIDHESESGTSKEASLRAIQYKDVKFSQASSFRIEGNTIYRKNLSVSTATVALMVLMKKISSVLSVSQREDEKAQIKATGGSVIVCGVPGVNGVLALCRYGIIAVLEFLK